MFRITEILQDDGTVSLKMDGRVVGASVSELERSCLHWRREKNKLVVLDFGGVSFIDRNAVRMLEVIKDERVKIINCSPFIRSLLRDVISGG